MRLAKRITEHSTAGTSARDLVRDKGPRSLLAAPSILPETASASPRAVGPPAAAHPESPRRYRAIAGLAAAHAPHIRRVDLLGGGYLCDGRVRAGFEQLLPPERPGDRLDYGVVDARPRRRPGL